MSIDRCQSCSRSVDTDDDVDCYDSEGQCFCAPCRARQLEEGRSLALDHSSDLNRAAYSRREKQDIIDAGRGHLLPEAWED